MQGSNHDPSEQAQPRPLTIGNANSEGMTGRPLRFWIDKAAELGIEPIKVGGRVVFIADDLLGALEARRVNTPARPIAPEPGTKTEFETMREQLATKLRNVGGCR
jgi:hypothetical protein